MRFRVLFLFVAIQLAAFALWGALQPSPVFTSSTAQPVSASVHSAAAPVHFSAINIAPAMPGDSGAETLVLDVFKKLPENHVSAVKDVILDYDPEVHRGRGGQELIILRATMDPEEFAGVLVHELAHNVDLVALRATDATQASAFYDMGVPVYAGDMSLNFYRISWTNETTRKAGASNMDFVSGYAMTDPFEDFAETYAYYVLQNASFRAKTAGSAALLAKWRFMKEQVFGGREFSTGDPQTDIARRPWDVTVLPYDLTAFLR